MKKVILSLCLLVGSLSAFAHDGVNDAGHKIMVDQTNPYHMINQVAEITFKRFADEQKEIQNNPNILKDIVREELVPYINYRYAALKVLGKNLRKQKREDVEAFIPVFRDYLITSYAQVFTLYEQQKVEFEPAKSLEDRKTVAVDVEVIQPGGSPIKISFQVRKDSNSSRWQAFNMIAEGVSLLDSKRAELSSLINQKGLPYVTELLKEKSQRDIYFKQA
ncbi:ABC transporter substrate-binding protein [Thalassotalea agariperforans]